MINNALSLISFIGVIVMCYGVIVGMVNRRSCGGFMNPPLMIGLCLLAPMILGVLLPAITGAVVSLIGWSVDSAPPKPKPHPHPTSSVSTHVPATARPKIQTDTSSHSSSIPAIAWWILLFIFVAAFLVGVLVVLAVTTSRRAKAAKALRVAFTDLATQWSAIDAERKKQSDRWLTYDTNLHALLTAPAMRDFGAATTLAAASALGVAEKLSHRAPIRGSDFKDVHALIDAYESSVTALTAALDAAIRFARRESKNAMTPRQRKDLERARYALNIALDNAASETEVSMALRLVSKVLADLGVTPNVHLMQQIEQRTRLQLEKSC